MDTPVRMASLTWVAGAFRAQVLAARLESEGIDAQLRGALASPYGLTMGEMARVDVFVPEDQLEDAKYVLLVDEVEATLDAPSEWWDAGADRPRSPRRWSWFVAATLLATTVFGVVVGLVHHW
jgi:hypothetical protein